MAYSKQQLKAHRVARKLRGIKGVPTVQVTQEFWRRKYALRSSERTALTAFIQGRQRWTREFGGRGLWSKSICVDVDGVLKTAPDARNGRWIAVGRIYKDAVVLHRKKAPRWLLNWAMYINGVYVLNGISRQALRAHLVREKLR